jgi:hypothetical protein
LDFDLKLNSSLENILDDYEKAFTGKESFAIGGNVYPFMYFNSCIEKMLKLLGKIKAIAKEKLYYETVWNCEFLEEKLNNIKNNLKYWGVKKG